MVTYDNGCIPGIDNIKEVADRIIKKYGSSKALFLGVQSVTAYLFRFQEPFLYNTTGEFSKKYPNLHPAQLPCLACHMGMFVRAIAYCKVHNISYIAAGIRNLDNAFFMPDMVRRCEDLAKENGIHLILPVYNLTDNWNLKLELTDRGFIPKVVGYQCWIGYRASEKLCIDEINGLLLYYDEAISPKIQSFIDEAEKICSIDKTYSKCFENHDET